MTDLAEIRARCEAATPGPWESVQDYYDGPWYMLYEQRCAGDNKTSDLFDGRSHYLIDAPNNAAFAAHAREDIPALLAEVERLRADAELGRLVREVLPLMAVEPPANHHTALICWGGSGWDVFYACDDWSLPDTAPSTTPEDALRSARENMEQHRMLVGYYPDFRAAEAQT
jgi:hypothetical protein